METTKICCTCKVPKPLDEFSIRKDRTELYYQSSCKLCHSAYRREHYLANKQKYIIKAKDYNKSVHEWFLEIKKTLKCIKCEEDRYWVLDFHHRDPDEKEYSLGQLASSCGSKQKIIKEMEKCDVLCSNCHRDLHHHLRNCRIGVNGNM